MSNPLAVAVVLFVLTISSAIAGANAGAGVNGAACVVGRELLTTLSLRNNPSHLFSPTATGYITYTGELPTASSLIATLNHEINTTSTLAYFPLLGIDSPTGIGCGLHTLHSGVLATPPPLSDPFSYTYATYIRVEIDPSSGLITRFEAYPPTHQHPPGYPTPPGLASHVALARMEAYCQAWNTLNISTIMSFYSPSIIASFDDSPLDYAALKTHISSIIASWRRDSGTAPFGYQISGNYVVALITDSLYPVSSGSGDQPVQSEFLTALAFHHFDPATLLIDSLIQYDFSLAPSS